MRTESLSVVPTGERGGLRPSSTVLHVAFFSIALYGMLLAVQSLAYHPWVSNFFLLPLDVVQSALGLQTAALQTGGTAALGLLAILAHGLSIALVRPSPPMPRSEHDLRIEALQRELQLAGEAGRTLETCRNMLGTVKRSDRELSAWLNAMHESLNLLRTANESSVQTLRALRAHTEQPNPDREHIDVWLQHIVRRLEEFSRIWQAVMAAVPMRVAVIDRAGQVRYCNEPHPGSDGLNDPARLVQDHTEPGHSPQVLQLFANSNIGEDDRQALQEAIATLRPWTGEVMRQLESDDGSDELRSYQEHVLPLNAPGAPPCAVLTSVDVTGADLQVRAKLLGLYSRLATVSRHERRILRTKLHDTVANDLTAIRMDLEKIKLGSSRSDMLLEQAHANARRTEALLRNIMTALAPREGQSMDLAAEMDHLRRYMNMFHGLELQVPESVSGTLPPDLLTPVVSVLSEGLLNIAKHAYDRDAPDRRAAITVSARDSADETVLRIVLRDWGRGFEPRSRKLQEVTLRLNDRLSGTPLRCEVRSECGTGTVIVMHARLTP